MFALDTVIKEIFGTRADAERGAAAADEVTSRVNNLEREGARDMLGADRRHIAAPEVLPRVVDDGAGR